MQSLCALVGADNNEGGVHDYATHFLVADELRVQAEEELFRRVCFDVLAANNDDHTKNHSFIKSENGEWQLSPAEAEISPLRTAEVRARLDDVHLEVFG